VNELLKENAAVVSLLTFFLGLIIGNRLALNRDRRKEYNNFVQPIRSWLLLELKDPSPYRAEPSRMEMDNFIHYLPMWKRKKFQDYLNDLKKIQEQNSYVNDVGQVFYENEEDIKTIIKKCLSYTKKK
jgi:hypothetical protein